MRKVLLAGLVCSVVCEIASPARASISGDEAYLIFGQSCVAYGVQQYSVADIQSVIRSEVAKKDILGAKEEQLLADPRTSKAAARVILEHRESVSNGILDQTLHSCAPGSKLAKYYYQNGYVGIQQKQ